MKLNPTKTRYTAGLLLLICFTHCSPSKPAGDSGNNGPRIQYSDKRLTWDDFQGFAEQASPHSALTHWSLNDRSFLRNGNELHIMVVAWFYPKLSWVKNPSFGNQYLLSHEQHHFDLAELYARKFRKALSSTSFDITTYRQQITTLFRATLSRLKAEQDRYDDESDHDRNKSAQYTWMDTIDRELASLSEFANPEVVVTIPSSSTR